MFFPRIVQSFLLPVLSLLLVNFNTPLIGQEAGQSFVNGATRVLSSDILRQEQTIFIVLPEEYEESDQAYPVHYVTDAPSLRFEVMELCIQYASFRI